jgi:hypothetical protein
VRLSLEVSTTVICPVLRTMEWLPEVNRLLELWRKCPGSISGSGAGSFCRVAEASCILRSAQIVPHQIASVRVHHDANIRDGGKTVHVDFKGTVSRIYFFRFFYESFSPKPLKIALGSFQIFSQILEDIRKPRCTTGINDTIGKEKDTSHKFATNTAGVVDTAGATTGVNDPSVKKK